MVDFFEDSAHYFTQAFFERYNCFGISSVDIPVAYISCIGPAFSPFVYRSHIYFHSKRVRSYSVLGTRNVHA